MNTSKAGKVIRLIRVNCAQTSLRSTSFIGGLVNRLSCAAAVPSPPLLKIKQPLDLPLPLLDRLQNHAATARVIGSGGATSAGRPKSLRQA